MRRHRAAGVMALLLFAARPGTGRAALEASVGDPLVSGRVGYNPAGRVARPVAEGPCLFGGSVRAGLAFFTARWEALPGLQRRGVVAWLPVGASRLVLAGRQLTITGYSETELGFDWCHPARRAGEWSWAAGLSSAAWQVVPGAGHVLRWSGALGYQPGNNSRLGLRLSDEAGGRGLTPAFAQVGMSIDLDPTWRAGLEFERIDDGAWRLRAEVEAIAGGGLGLAAGFEPASGTAALGFSLRRGLFGVDVARLDHPRLGAVSSAGFSLGGGAAP